MHGQFVAELRNRLTTAITASVEERTAPTTSPA
jgi:hypothetical protein